MYFDCVMESTLCLFFLDGLDFVLLMLVDFMLFIRAFILNTI
uniref:Uncharacterized protein n=1 Tax=Anguilla anguilla TaxID=7936 RepID=A0A0E9SL10_ANGAN